MDSKTFAKDVDADLQFIESINTRLSVISIKIGKLEERKAILEGVE